MTPRHQAFAFLALRLLSNVIGAGCLLVAGWYSWAEVNAVAVALGLTGLGLTTVPSLFRSIGLIKETSRAGREHALAILAEATYLVLSFDEKTDLRVTVLEPRGRQDRRRLVQTARFALKNGHCVRTPGKSAMRVSQGFAGRALNGNKVEVKGSIEDFYKEMEAVGFSEDEAKAFRSDRKTYACFPIPNREEQPIGVLALDAKIPEIFTGTVLKVLEDTFLPLYSRLLTGPHPSEVED